MAMQERSRPMRIVGLDHVQLAMPAGGAVTPDTTLPNVRRFFVADPFGNRIEILQDGDGY